VQKKNQGGYLKVSAVILRGLSFGDEGKGSITDLLAALLGIKNVCRDNGGSQAIHQVVLDDGRIHRFSQFSSATFQEGSATLLSRGMLVNPMNLVREDRVLREKGIVDAMERITIEPDCAVITPLHKMLGQMKEVARGQACHGSTGMGVGQAAKDRELLAQDALRMEDLLNPSLLVHKLARHFDEKFAAAAKLVDENPQNRELHRMYCQYLEAMSYEKLLGQYVWFGREYGDAIHPISDMNRLVDEGIIFEGAQGTLLDPRTCPPYVTKTKTTADSALDIIGHGGTTGKIRKLGILRAYFTRHGAGQFVTESPDLSKLLPDSNNIEGRWQGPFRVGWFDLVAANFAIDLNGGIDSIALTNLDRLSEFAHIPVCATYQYTGDRYDLLDDLFEWRIHNGAYILERIKTGQRADRARAQLAGILLDCEPGEKIVMDGWKTGISNAKKLEDLPREAREYLNLLESADGFDTPISVVSVGETREQKFLVFDPCD
jgi:adenylosuccinate synthase